MFINDFNQRLWSIDVELLMRLDHIMVHNSSETYRKLRNQLYAKMLDRYGPTAMKGL